MSERDHVDGARYRGAIARWCGRDRPEDNPYPNMPGSYVLHRAWLDGFNNCERFLAQHDGEPEGVDYELPDIPDKPQWSKQ